MTTIAWDGITLAAESRMMDSNTISQEFGRKIWRIDETTIVAFAGGILPGLAFVKALKAGVSDHKLDDCWALLIKGKSCFYCEDTYRMRVKPPYILGGGGQYAMAAMMAGADAKKAVQIACKIDPSSGGRVITMQPIKLP